MQPLSYLLFHDLKTRLLTQETVYLLVTIQFF